MFLWISVKFRSVPRNSGDISSRKKQSSHPVEFFKRRIHSSMQALHGPGHQRTSLLGHPVVLCAHQYTQESPTLEINPNMWIIIHKFRPISGQTFAQRLFLPTFLRTILNTHHFLEHCFFCPCSWGALSCFSAREMQIFAKHPLAKVFCTLKPAQPFVLDNAYFWEGMAIILASSLCSEV